MVNLVDLPGANPKPLNGAQFSQGTLWDPKALKPSAEHRWRAGYSPERKAEVSQALTGDVKTAKSYRYGIGDQGVFKYPDEFGSGSPRRQSAARSTQARNAIVDVVARSTIPVEDLRNAPHFDLKSSGTAQGRYRSPGTMVKKRQGRYERVERERPIIDLDPSAHTRESMEHTIVHELGHHADFMDIGQHEFRRRFMGQSRGVPVALEGAAEGYAAKHHVPRRSAPEGHSYADEASYKESQSHPVFQEHFARVAGKTVSEAMAKPQGHHMSEHQFQPHLFGRNADQAETEIAADYGQWGYRNMSTKMESNLGTIRVGQGPPASAHYPGFQSGDEEHIKALRQGRFYDVPGGDRERIDEAWRRRHGNRPIRE